MSKIALPIAELKPALIGLGKVINKRCTLPVLSHIKIERTKDGWIALTSTDLDSFVTVRLEQPSDGEAVELLVPYEDLLKIMKNCQKTDTVAIRTGENLSELSVLVEYPVGQQTAEAKLTSLPVVEFPEIPRIKGEPVPVSDAVRQSIHEAFDCASTDETRLILNSAFIDVSKEDGHYIVGTNGSILFSSNSFKLPLKECLVLPTHKFLSYREFNGDGEWQLKISEPQHKDDNVWFQIASRRWRFIGRQIDGAYPNWRQVVPGDSQFTSSVQFDDLDTLADTIDRLPDHDPVNHAIGIEKKDEAVNLLWKPEKDHEWKRLPVTVHQVTGDDITIYLNRHYLTKALRFGLSRFGCIDPMSPVKFGNEGKQMIVMPVRAESTPTAASQAQETPSQQLAAPSPAATEERTPMVNETTTDGSSKPAEPITIDAQLSSIINDAESLRTTVQDTLGEVNVLCKKLKTFQREHKSSTKDLQSVRQTLEKLQSVRL
jgi:DNA polymerase III sliding clamp (beta) subunit (PCNA family)